MCVPGRSLSMTIIADAGIGQRAGDASAIEIASAGANIKRSSFRGGAA